MTKERGTVQESANTPPPTSKSAPGELQVPSISRGLRIANLIVVILPFLAFAAVAVSLWGRAFGWVDLGLLLGMYMVTGLGITVGYHRLFTHRSFETNRAVQFLLAVFGSMALEGPLLKWVAIHRRHHQYSDTQLDPHSPHREGQSIGELVRGLWHAHLGWIFQPEPANLSHYVKDLRQSRLLRMVSALFPIWVAIGLLIPAMLGGLLTGTWMGAATGLVWGCLARIFLVHHVTWGVNSLCHFWGGQPFRTGDESRNNFLFGAMGLGEGWHNNHHAFPTSARFGLRWWQIDVGYWFIGALSLLGLASTVRTSLQTVTGNTLGAKEHWNPPGRGDAL
jgi:stearoyl-CoA desaturase (delta-9 desaturase)